MTTDLTKISGIGLNSAKALKEAGFDSIETIAKSTPAALGKVSGFGAKRAERVIASAKELVQEAKPAPAVKAKPAIKIKPTPVVAAKRSARRSRTRTFFATAAVLLLLVAAVVYFGYRNEVGDFMPFQTAKQETTNDASNQAAMKPEQQAMNGQRAPAPGQHPMNGQRPMNGAGNREFVAMSPMQRPQHPSAMQRQANQPEWVTRQRAQADARRAQANAQAEMHRARAEKINEESFKRFVASLPPAQAEQVVRQHEMAMQQMAESKKRHEAMVQQQNAYMNQRFGG